MYRMAKMRPKRDIFCKRALWLVALLRKDATPKEPLIIGLFCRKCYVHGGEDASFRKRATNHRALLRKMSSKDKASHSSCTGWQRCEGCLIFRGHFPQNSPMISGSFAERDLQLKASHASLPPCSVSWISLYPNASFRKRATNHRALLQKMSLFGRIFLYCELDKFVSQLWCTTKCAV